MIFLAKCCRFFTRNPERVKFTNGFNPVVGVIARIVNGKGPEFNQESLQLDKLSLETNIDSEIVRQLFSTPMYREMHSSKLLQYIALSDSQESKGEIRLGQFLISLLELNNDADFIQYFGEAQPNNLYEKVVFDSLENGEQQSKTDKRNFKYYDQHHFSKLFHSDILHLMSDRNYFYDNIGALLEFYYFSYVSQTIVRISDETVTETIIPLYFSLENEPISRSRKAVSNGFRLVNDHSWDLLTDVDMLNYLNALIPDKNRFYWKNEILAPDFEYQVELGNNLAEFLPQLYQLLDSQVTSNVSLNLSTLQAAVQSLRLLLHNRNKNSRETSSRFALSFNEICKQGFTRPHGQLGRTFSMSKHTVLLLTAAIVGKGKLLLRDVFKAFEERGVYFDRITRDKVISLFEQANILEKLSDSGDAQYVRGIL
ncbi:DNA phosphorothioation-dependent restriction protein DptG [Secundilactobacillus collinoides]|uniref:DNA phosphorothioation-dependent restriction protein DptG n=1 Tax=Secundilactobacillus collinoides TaxID=33960 RepID=UPI0006D28E43|nr:DNA phosphorothioation-dependent restriction protein DptG [Secundilactobacillus collinoides]